MKVKVADLLANPHRRIKEYEIQPDRVEMLMNSIKETFFWDNLIARPAPNNSGKYEIAYGHHRLAALRKLKIEEIDIPIKEISDETMLKIMADENAEEYSMSPAVLNETVLSVKLWLDTQIKDSTWESLQQSLRTLFDRKDGFSNCKNYGAGETLISKFLGKNWKLSRIREALASLHTDESTFDRKAAEKMKSIEAAQSFRKAVKAYKIPKPQQAKLAKELSDKKASGREVKLAIRKAAPEAKRPAKDPHLLELETKCESIEEKALSLTTSFRGFNALARDLNVTEIAGLARLIQVQVICELLDEIKEYLKLFGYDYKSLKIGGKNE